MNQTDMNAEKFNIDHVKHVQLDECTFVGKKCDLASKLELLKQVKLI